MRKRGEGKEWKIAFSVVLGAIFVLLAANLSITNKIYSSIYWLNYQIDSGLSPFSISGDGYSGIDFFTGNERNPGVFPKPGNCDASGETCCYAGILFCQNGLYCDTFLEPPLCVACIPFGLPSIGCSEFEPLCIDGECKCTNDLQCSPISGGTWTCDEGSGRCIECENDESCAENPLCIDEPYFCVCRSDNRCVECNIDDDCGPGERCGIHNLCYPEENVKSCGDDCADMPFGVSCQVGCGCVVIENPPGVFGSYCGGIAIIQEP